jgi:flagellar biosynthesis activator protein FlaF
MQSAAQAYGSVARKIVSPRELEADLLLKAASRLQSVHDGWHATESQLSDALLYNRKLWTIFMTSVTEPDSPLPIEVRQNIANLGLFVMNQTMKVMSEPGPERLRSLIAINREIAAGLLGRS